MPAQLVQVGPSPADILLRRPRNWPLATVVLALALAHFGVAAVRPTPDPLPILLGDAMGLALLIVALCIWTARHEVEISVTRQTVCLRRRVGPWQSQRYLAFGRIQAVRLIQTEHRGRHTSQIELVADSEDIPCPTTRAPRQQALLLAMALKVRLIKIWNSTTPTAPEERIHQLTGSA